MRSFSRPKLAVTSRRRSSRLAPISAEILESRILLAAPVAEDDVVATDENTVLMGNVLIDNGSGADSDADGNPLTVDAVNGNTAVVGMPITLGSGATLTLNANGDFTYDPTAAFDDIALGDSETDSFTYRINDGLLGTSTATVTIIIAGVNGAPSVIGEFVQIRESETASGSLFANDSDPDGDTLTVTAVNGSAMSVGTQITLASGALLTVNSNGAYFYQPDGQLLQLDAGESFLDSFTYTVSDGNGAMGSATFTIRINGAGTSDLVAFHAGNWRVGVSTGSAFSSSNWAAWADVAWDALSQGDFNGDGRADVIGLLDGVWHVGISTGSSFTTSQWTIWADVVWENATIGDLDGDGRDDILARINGAWWAALSTGTAFGGPLHWATWSALPWQTQLVDLDNDGNEDLLAFYAGEWWAALSNGGTAFGAASQWAKWSNVSWQTGTFDVDNDGQTDVFGLIAGEWYVGRSTGTGFSTSLRVRWAVANWQDARAGDFNGDGRDDLIARYAGQWWVTTSGTGTGGVGGPTSRFASWSDVAWQDVRIGDFNGDGSDDIAGRFAGEWWVGRSSGATFQTSKWAIWSDVAWQAVAAVDADNFVIAAAPPLSAVAGAASLASKAEEASLALFWAQSVEDDELAAGLLNAAA